MSDTPTNSPVEGLQQAANAAKQLRHQIEPKFVLRAKDAAAPAMLVAWATETMKNLSSSQDQAGTLTKIKDAQAMALEMQAWQIRNGSKVAD